MQIRLSPEFPQQIRRVWQLSIPAILTQISSIVMQYIDSAMVGSLGANASAAIGLVSTSTWLLGGLCSAVSAGFSVQIAHQIGAGEHKKARDVLKHGIFTALILSGILMLGGIAISWQLPVWLGGEEILHRDASLYFLVYAATLPFTQLNWLASACLQCSGNMVTPSILNAVACLLDVVFNAIFIPRYGVLGAALGTGLAMGVVSIVMMWACFFRAPELNLRRKEHCALDKGILKRALRIGSPVGAEQIATSGAMVVTTMIVAPLGTIAIAANSFAITAESLCYMPGYGIGAAATTLVGQSIGAGEHALAKKYGNMAIGLGCAVMTLMAVLMYFLCPLVFQMLTPDLSVRALGAEVLRIGLIAEPLYAVSIVASGALRGAEDTLVPSLLNLASIWIVRIGLALLLVVPFGLHGIWAAMATELCVRGLLLLLRQCRSKYYTGARRKHTPALE